MLEYETETDKFEFMLAKIIVWSRNNVEKTSRSLKHFWTEYYITQATKRIFGFLNTVAQSATSEYTLSFLIVIMHWTLPTMWNYNSVSALTLLKSNTMKQFSCRMAKLIVSS